MTLKPLSNNLARLQDNTLAYRRSLLPPHQTQHQYTSQVLPHSTSFKQNTPLPYSRHPAPQTFNTFKPQHNSILPTPTTHSSQKPTRLIRPRDLKERRAKGLCFWCDEHFIPDHICKNKRLYSLYIIEDDGDIIDTKREINIVEHDSLTPHISLNALKGMMGYHTLRLTRKADKHPIYILIDSDNTHNFPNSMTTNKL